MNTREIIEQAYDCYARGDVSAALDYFADDMCFIWNAKEGHSPFCGTCRSREMFRERLDALIAVWDIREYRCIEVLVDGDRAASRVAITVANRATGCEVSSQLGHFWTVSDGQIRELIEFYDTGAALGAMAEPSSE